MNIGPRQRFKIVKLMTKVAKMILYLMVASSFFWGHQEPAAIIVSLPGLTRILILDQTDE